MSPLILAVDTTHEYGSIALARGDELLEEMPLHAPRRLCPDPLRAFARVAGAPRRRARAISTASPPPRDRARSPACGSGWRASRDWPRRSRKPAVGGFESRGVGRFGSGPLRAAVLDARRGDVYGAVYDAAGGIVVPEMVAKLPVWLAALPHGVEFVSNDFTAFGDRSARRPARDRPARIGRSRGADRRDSRSQDPAALDANYVRRSDAEMAWKDPGR